MDKHFYVFSILSFLGGCFESIMIVQGPQIHDIWKIYIYGIFKNKPYCNIKQIFEIKKLHNMFSRNLNRLKQISIDY